MPEGSHYEELQSGESQYSKKPSKWWYLLPLFLGILGGIAAYLLLQDRDKYFAKKTLIFGIVMTIIFVVLPPVALYSIGVFTPPPTIGPSSPIDTSSSSGTTSSSSTNLVCFPCFHNFKFINYTDGNLILKNGAYDLENVSATCDPDTPPNCYVYPKQIDANQKFNIANIDISDNIEITIIYTKKASGLQHQDTAIFKLKQDS